MEIRVSPHRPKFRSIGHGPGPVDKECQIGGAEHPRAEAEIRPGPLVEARENHGIEALSRDGCGREYAHDTAHPPACTEGVLRHGLGLDVRHEHRDVVASASLFVAVGRSKERAERIEASVGELCARARLHACSHGNRLVLPSRCKVRSLPRRPQERENP